MTELTGEHPVTGHVTIMMPVYNAERYLTRSIDSVLAQTYTNWELIAVNDGSTDQSLAILESYTDPRIKVISQDNRGEAAARNAALDRMRGEFLAFLDADDLFGPDHLQLTVSYLQERDDFAGVYGDGTYIDHEGKAIEALSDHRRGPFSGDLFEPLVRASDVFGPPICLLLRTQVIRNSHLRFDTRITIGPDWDFTIHFAERARIGHIPDKTVFYRVHADNITRRAEQKTRRLSLAQCRENAIKCERFASCSPEVRGYVFYELLVELLNGDPARQLDIIRWPEFLDLPAGERGRILRLMASSALKSDVRDASIQGWLEQARELNPDDNRTYFLNRLYRFSPWLCRVLLKLRNLVLPAERLYSPFGSLE